MAEHGTDAIVAGRACQDCTLCCKLLAVAELAKPPGVWCSHCKPGHGCLIYESRPPNCRVFHCGYLKSADLGEEWKPSRCRIVLAPEAGVNRIVAFVDPARPDAWKREPHYSGLKKLAATAAMHNGWVIVRIARRTHVIFPDRDVDLGDVTDDETVITGKHPTPSGFRLEAYKVRRDDPRALELLRQQGVGEADRAV
jgi:hypothetical protein